jgi:hypothetical protein
VRNVSIYPRISNLTSKSIPFGISALKGHSHSLAPYAPVFLASETGRWRRVPKNVGQPLLYSPPSGHPRDSLLGHPPRPTLRRAPVHSPLGTRRAIPLGTRRSVGPFRRATPSGIEFISSTSLLTVVFIHFQESSSTDHKMHPLSRKLITCSEILSSVEKFHPLFKKCTYCVASSSFAYQIHPLCHFLSEGIRKIIHGKPRNLQ